MEQTEEIMQLRRDLNNLKEIVENLAILLNRKLMKELYEEAQNVENGEYIAEEEFSDKQTLKLNLN